MNFHFRELDPSPGLSDIVKSFFVLDYSIDSRENDFLLPNGTPSFFKLTAPAGFDAHFLNSKNPQHLKEGVYVGYTKTLIEISHERMNVVGVSLYPTYLYLIFSLTLKDITNSFVDVSHLDGIAPLLEGFSTEEETISFMEDFIATKFRSVEVRTDIQAVFQEITEGSGYRLTVDEIAKKMGYSRRYLTELFNTHMGMSAKQFLKLARFNQALKFIDEMKEGDTYSSIAHSLGYHDQAHFIRDFKSVCGKTPGELKEWPDSLAYQFRYFK